MGLSSLPKAPPILQPCARYMAQPWALPCCGCLVQEQV